MTAPASRIAAATVLGGSEPGSGGIGIRETTATPSRASMPVDQPGHDVGVGPVVGQQQDLLT